MSVSIDRYDFGRIQHYNWVKLLQLRYDDVNDTCDQFIAGGTDMFSLIDGN
jgi:hypothetical protein